MDEWTQTGVGYEDRVRHLRGTMAGGLNGMVLLNETTVHDDGDKDELTDGSALDWFRANVVGSGKKDKLIDAAAGEVITDINL